MSVFAGVKRSVSSLKAQTDADGNAVEVEVRFDEEQQVKYEQILELLLAAGYFRARISGLSQFDKVVGGMVWSITASNVDVDVDLLFQENSTIKQKIFLTEKIVSALAQMKYPFRIDPHQIQGLDCIHIYPVIQWLVKKVIETREEMGDYIRNFSESQFGKTHTLPQDEEFQQRKAITTSTVSSVKKSYKPQRQYRKPSDSRHSRHFSQLHDRSEEEMRVQTTLLEYGQRYRLSRQQQQQQDKKKIDDKVPAGLQQKKKDNNTEEMDAEEEERKVRELMASMAAMEGKEGAVSSSAIGSIVGLQSDEIRELVSEYNKRQSELGSLSGSGGAQTHKRLVASLEKQITMMEKRHGEVCEVHTRLTQQYGAVQNELSAVQARNSQLDAELAKFDSMKTPENEEVIERLRSLVTLNESLKRQEQEFRASCKEELSRFQSLIEKLKSGENSTDSEEVEKLRLINEQFDADKDRLAKIKVLLGKKNRDISAIQRLIDEIPSRSELSQYQKRFVELYNQVAAKLTETKQYYTLYNILDDKKLYISKEIALLESIHNTFERAMAAAQAKESFLSQFENIVNGVRTNLEKVEKRKTQEKARRDGINDAYLDLVEKQRLYYKTIKEFQEECRKNEELLNR